jgi:predicted heme/steroid binding protein
MRILIIAQPRTGSTVFSKWLSKELNYYWLNEPFNSHNKIEIDKVFTKNNIVCKLIFQENRGEWFYDNRIENTINLLSLSWDSIFILTRNDVYDQSISKVWGDINHKWHENYEITQDWLQQNKNHIEKYYKELEFEKIKINSFHFNQISYEGIYETGLDLSKVCSSVGIDKMHYFDDLSLKNRYRGGKIIKKNKLI